MSLFADDFLDRPLQPGIEYMVVCLNYSEFPTESGLLDWVGEKPTESGSTDWVGEFWLSRDFCILEKKNCFTMQRKYLEAKKRRSGRSTTKASLDLACSTLALTSFLVHFLEIISAGCRALLFPPARLILKFRKIQKERLQNFDSRLSRNFPDSVGTFWIIQTERTLFSCLNYSEIPDWVRILNNSDILPNAFNRFKLSEMLEWIKVPRADKFV